MLFCFFFYLNKCLAHTMQCIGSDGVLRIVKPGNDLTGGLGKQS